MATSDSPLSVPNVTLTDGTNELLATGSLDESQSVTDGSTFTLDAIDITIREAT